MAFWSEYRPDPDDGNTYVLLSFDGEPVQAGGPVARVETTPGAVVVEEGRFGKGLRLNGRGGVRCQPRAAFAGGLVSLEAWVKLERYPEQNGYVLFRRAAAGAGRSQGFALAVDNRGGLHLETVNASGRRLRTSSPPAAVPLGKWVHVAGISGPGRRLFVDGRMVADQPLHYGEGLQDLTETEPPAIFIGNDDTGDAGLTGLMDQVRVHRNVLKFWPPEDDSWTDPKATRAIASGPPHFVAAHAARVSLPLDEPISEVPGAKVELGAGAFRPGVRGKAYAGKITITAPGLFRSAEGSLEFWLRPTGVNSLSDRNRYFLGEPFPFYLLNGASHEPTLFFDDREQGLHFVPAPVEMHPGRWYHVVFTWRGPDIAIYLDGTLRGHTIGRPLVPNGRTEADRFVFNASETIGLIDEVRIYDRALLSEEASNAYWRYRDPAKLIADVRLPALDLIGEYLPSRQAIRYTVTPRDVSDDAAAVRFALRDEKNTLVSEVRTAWAEPLVGEFELPELADGAYTLTPILVARDGRERPGRSFPFLARRFPWVGNTLGITDEVFPPFEPVTVQGRRVAVVGRTMTWNDFGLWDEVQTLGRDLLAAPMRSALRDGGRSRYLDPVRRPSRHEDRRARRVRRDRPGRCCHPQGTLRDRGGRLHAGRSDAGAGAIPGRGPQTLDRDPAQGRRSPVDARDRRRAPK